MKDFVLERLEQALEDYALDLAQKAAKGELSAAEANHLRGLFRDAGGSLAFGGSATKTGDAVLEAMSDVDIEALLN